MVLRNFASILKIKQESIPFRQSKMTNFRKIASRYEKLAHVSLVTVYVASICILLKILLLLILMTIKLSLCTVDISSFIVRLPNNKR